MTQKEDAHFALSSPSALLTSLRWCLGLFWGKISCHNAAEKLSQFFFPGGYSQWATLANGEICASADPKEKKKTSLCVIICDDLPLKLHEHTHSTVCLFFPSSPTNAHTHAYVLSKVEDRGWGFHCKVMNDFVIHHTDTRSTERGGKDEFRRALIFTVERVTEVKKK